MTLNGEDGDNAAAKSAQDPLGTQDAVPNTASAAVDNEPTLILHRAQPAGGEPPVAGRHEPGSMPGSSWPGSTLSESSGERTADQSVRQAGRYEIQGKIGRGGMATVFRAHDPALNRTVAIKFLHPGLAEEPEWRERFLKEAKTSANLQHAHIVVVHDVGEIKGRPYMAMELIEGPTLAEVLADKKQLPIRQAVVVALQVARALDHAHAHGVSAHRDIKPGNIMFLPDRETVKVTDFGIAHVDDGSGQVTSEGPIGTPQYMSPEQARGEKPNGRSDIFSTGIVLFQMLAGERPFKGDTMVEVVPRIANDKPRPVTELRSDVPQSLRRIVDRCLAKNPADRYATGGDLANALVQALADIDEAGRAASYRFVSLRVRWALAMAAIIAVVMGITGTLVTQRQYAALMGQATEYGASLARFIARQNALSALTEDWTTVDVGIQEMMKTGTFERILVLDKAGIVRAASIPSLMNSPYKGPAQEVLGKLSDDSTVSRYRAGTETVLGFEAPVSYQQTPAGRVLLGIREAPLAKVAELSIGLMLLLALVTVAAVGLATYVLADRFARPIRLMRNSLREIAQGNLGHRIAEERKDDFGQLFADFDAMAQALESRTTPSSDTSPTEGSAPVP